MSLFISSFVPTSPRTWVLTKVMVGPRRLGPLGGWTDGPESQELAGESSRGGGGIKARGVEASDFGNPNSEDEPTKVVSKPHSSTE